MTAYYNEFDPFAADWIENLIKEGLIPNGIVDRRSITEVSPDDIRGFTQCHFFAGIAGWALALRLAGWPDDKPVGSGSCPCQPYSSAGKQLAQDDPRHLWPVMFNLVRDSGINTWFGEQVAAAIGHGWLDGVFADLEAEDFTCGAAVLGAHSTGRPHIRQRLYWVADSSGERARRNSGTAPSTKTKGCGERISDGMQRCDGVEPSCSVDWLGNATSQRWDAERVFDNTSERSGFTSGDSGSDSGMEHATSDGRNERWTESIGRITSSGCGNSRLGDTNNKGSQGRGTVRSGSRELLTRSAGVAIACLDGKSRRIEPSIQPLAHGIPRDMVSRKPELRSVVRSARSNRVGRLKGYGNAIIPQVAAEFISAFIEEQQERNHLAGKDH